MDFAGTLSVGSKGEAVRFAQVALNANGARVTPDGNFGPLTRAAVVAFQKARSLPETGNVDSATWAAFTATPAPAAGIVIDGRRVPVPGAEVVTWLDDDAVPRVKDGHTRAASAVKAIVLHTVHGKVGPLADRASAPSTRAERYARYQASTSRDVSWHFTVDTDGTIVQSCDAATWMAWHATAVNPWTIGIEMVQESDGTVYRPQLAVVVALCDVLCASLGIERRVPAINGAPIVGVVERLTGRHGSWSGVFGHRHQTTNRGPGDPGDHIFRALLAAGYAGVTP